MLDATAAKRALTAAAADHLWARWLFLRALGLIFLSAFYSFALQIHGLIGEHGILPAVRYLANIAAAVPAPQRFWYAPSLLWIGAGDRALTLVVGGGLLVLVGLAMVTGVWDLLTGWTQGLVGRFGSTIL